MKFNYCGGGYYLICDNDVVYCGNERTYNKFKEELSAGKITKEFISYAGEYPLDVVCKKFKSKSWEKITSCICCKEKL